MAIFYHRKWQFFREISPVENGWEAAGKRSGGRQETARIRPDQAESAGSVDPNPAFGALARVITV